MHGHSPIEPHGAIVVNAWLFFINILIKLVLCCTSSLKKNIYYLMGHAFTKLFSIKFYKYCKINFYLVVQLTQQLATLNWHISCM